MTVSRRIELSTLTSIFYHRISDTDDHQADNVLTLHDKARMIVNNDDAFQKLKQDLRNKRVTTNFGLNAVLPKCVDSRIERSNLKSLSDESRRRGNGRRQSSSFPNFADPGAITSATRESSRVFGHIGPSFASDENGTNDKIEFDLSQDAPCKTNVFQKIRAAIHLEDELTHARSNRDIYRKVERRTSTQRRSAFLRPDFHRSLSLKITPASNSVTKTDESESESEPVRADETNMFQKLRNALHLEAELKVPKIRRQSYGDVEKTSSVESLAKRRSSAYT